MKDKIATSLVIASAILIIIIGIYGVFLLKKTVSYNMFYKSRVEETVREMVKPEYLIDNK